MTGDPILPQLFHTKVNRFWLPSRGWLPRRMTGRETVEWCGMCTGIIAKLQSFCRLPYSLFPPSIDEIPYLDQLLRPHCDVTGRGLMRGTISQWPWFIQIDDLMTMPKDGWLNTIFDHGSYAIYLYNLRFHLDETTSSSIRRRFCAEPCFTWWSSDLPGQETFAFNLLLESGY